MMTMYGYNRFEDFKDLADSMTFDSGTTIASAIFNTKDKNIKVDLEVKGYVKVFYKDEVYKHWSDFPTELKEKILTTDYWYDDDIVVDENNWFEFMVDIITNDNKHYSDGVMCEFDLTKCTDEELKATMKEVAEWSVE